MTRLYLGNPFWMYAAIWLLVLQLVSMRLTTHLLPLHDDTVRLVLGNIATFAAGLAWMAFMARNMKASTPRQFHRDMIMLRRFMKTLLKIWAVGSVAEILIAGGVPLLWLAVGDTSRNYTDFGIPTVHGLFTAMYLFCLAGSFLEYLVYHRRRSGLLALVRVLLLMLWPVLQVNRGVGVWALLEMLGVYLIVRRIGVWRVVRASIVVVAAIVAFGVIGDARVGVEGRENLRAIVSETAPGAQYLRSAPSGFLWVYLYVTSGLNNLNRAIVERMPADGSLYFSTVNLLPTVIRSMVYNNPDRRYPVQLVNTAFNTSTWYSGFLVDFGFWWALTAPALLQLLGAWIYVRAQRRRVWAMLAYAAVFQGLALSIFADTFTSLVTLGQILIAVYFRSYVRATTRRWIARQVRPDRRPLGPRIAPA